MKLLTIVPQDGNAQEGAASYLVTAGEENRPADHKNSKRRKPEIHANAPIVVFTINHVVDPILIPNLPDLGHFHDSVSEAGAYLLVLSQVLRRRKRPTESFRAEEADDSTRNLTPLGLAHDGADRSFDFSFEFGVSWRRRRCLRRPIALPTPAPFRTRTPRQACRPLRSLRA